MLHNLFFAVLFFFVIHLQLFSVVIKVIIWQINLEQQQVVQTTSIFCCAPLVCLTVYLYVHMNLFILREGILACFLEQINVQNDAKTKYSKEKKKKEKKRIDNCLSILDTTDVRWASECMCISVVVLYQFSYIWTFNGEYQCPACSFQ